jgi:lipid II:glycine glycyltransferase (peptidoglycan interpeptide bridge formation enzyme)
MIDIAVRHRPDHPELAAWDTFVAGTAGSDVSQLSAWARVRQVAGYDPVYVLARDDGEVVGGAQVLIRRIAMIGSVGYVPFGPVIRPDLPHRAQVCQELGSALERLGGTHGRVLFLQPPKDADDVSAELLRRGFRPSDAMVAPQASIRLDLSLDEEALRQRMNKRLRGWTNRWAERGVTVRLGSREDLPLFTELHARTANYQGFKPLSLGYMETLYDALVTNGNIVVFVGQVDSRAVAVDLLTCCGGVLRDRLVGLDRSAQTSNLSVSGAVKWEAIRWAKANGFRWFDFGSLYLRTVKALLAGERLDPKMATGGDWFKISFGGEPYLNPTAVETASPRFLLQIYDHVRRSERGRGLLERLKRRLRTGV